MKYFTRAGGIILGFALTACTNNFTSMNANGGLNNLNGVTPSTTATAPVTLKQVIPDTFNPTSTLDLIGDGSGSIGAYCAIAGTGATPDPGSGISSASAPCACTFSFTLANGVSESFDGAVTYAESNLLRCTYSSVPAGITSMQVSLHLLSTNGYSNPITFQFAGVGSVLDPANPQSFSLVTRYQCRDSVTIPYMLDPNLYDPVQSEDPTLSYPLNFYTTNMGASFSLYSSSGVVNWNCPSLPNDPGAGLNLTVYSVSPDSSGSYLIYPPAGSAFDRSTFYAARSPAGVFNIPIDAYIAPQVVTSAPVAGGTTATTSAPNPIGYGAAPIPNGTGQESCPSASQATIPPGFHWVKVWLFRADLASRNYRTSTAITGTLNSVGCNPGDVASSSGGTVPVFQDCGSVNAGQSVAVNNNGTLADRILGTGMCMRLSGVIAPCGTVGPGCTTSAATGQPFAGFTNYAPGTDVWAFRDGKNKLGIPGDCGNNPVPDANGPANLCAAPKGVPNDPNPGLGNLDQNNTRFDFLFVVTPPSVMSSQMESPSGVAYTYTPYRFMTASECLSSNPSQPTTPGDCNPAFAIRNYGLKLHDVGTNGDPPANDPNRAGVFPVCALQPN